jgi:hypothetical protein
MLETWLGDADMLFLRRDRDDDAVLSPHSISGSSSVGIGQTVTWAPPGQPVTRFASNPQPRAATILDVWGGRTDDSARG